MVKNFVIVTIVIFLSLQCQGADLPSDIAKCKAGDNACIRDKIMELFKKFPKGNPEFGMPNISALSKNNVVISRASPDAPVQLNFKFLDYTCYGFENAVVVNTTGWTKKPKVIEAHLRVPSLRMGGEYEGSGKILFLTLNGKGKGLVELVDCTAFTKFEIRLEKRNNGKNYAKIIKMKVDLEPKKLKANMENLVPNSKELSDSLNDVLNNNWKDVWNALSDGISKAFSEAIAEKITQVFDVLSYDDFYAE